MIDPVEILWSPAGAAMPALGSHALTDVHDGDTPAIRMPIRMLSVDTPEVTAKTEERAAELDQEFLRLATWIREGRAPVSRDLADYLLPKIETGRAATLQFTQGNAAAEFARQNMRKRLALPDGKQRRLFVRTADAPFDDHHRLLAYVAPDYKPEERATMTREQRSTFNLDLIAAGWGAPFVIYPSIPGERDLPLMLAAADRAITEGRGIWADPATMPGYEYRAVAKLLEVTRKKVEGQELKPGEAFSWRSRYCADMRDRVLYGPEDYFRVPPVYRLWMWPQDVSEAVGRLNLRPAAELVGAR